MKLDKQKVIQELSIPDEMYDELLKDFAVQAEETIKKLEELAQSNNFDELAKTAHFIKGSAGNLRIEEMYAAAKEIEFAAKEKKDMAIIQGGIVKLKSEFEELKKIVS